MTAGSAELTATNTTLVAQLAETTKADKNQETMRKKFQNKYNKRFDRIVYCWSHGDNVTKMHTSKTCTDKNPAHQDGAARRNPMGGNTLDASVPDVKVEEN